MKQKEWLKINKATKILTFSLALFLFSGCTDDTPNTNTRANERRWEFNTDIQDLKVDVKEIELPNYNSDGSSLKCLVGNGPRRAMMTCDFQKQ